MLNPAALVTLGAAGLLCWLIAIVDDLVSLRFPARKTLGLTFTYNRLDDILIGVGFILITGFMAGLYSLISHAR